MTRVEVEVQVRAALRRTALKGSDREVHSDELLIGPGIGLDSMSIVGFLNTLETMFDSDLDPAIWSEPGALTIERIVRSLAAGDGTLSGTGAGAVLGVDAALAHVDVEAARAHPDAARFQRFAARWPLAARFQGPFWFGMRLTGAITRRLRTKHVFRVLERPLDSPVPSAPCSVPLERRLARLDDAPGLRDLWGDTAFEARAREFRDRVARGYLCLGAWREGRWAAIDYLSPGEDRDRFLGIRVRPSRGVVLGLGLYEPPALRGSGVGLALLEYSLHIARERGFERQVTIVRDQNEKMLLGAVQLFGFREIGRIDTRRVFGHARSSWVLRGRAGSGGVLEL